MTKEVAREYLLDVFKRRDNLYRCLALIVRYTRLMRAIVSIVEILAMYRIPVNGLGTIPPICYGNTYTTAHIVARK